MRFIYTKIYYNGYICANETKYIYCIAKKNKIIIIVIKYGKN